MENFKKFYNLGFDENIEENLPFSEFQKKILLKDVRDAAYNFISTSTVYNNSNYSRYFIMSFMIRYYNKSILVKDIFTPIYFLAKSVIISYIKLNENYDMYIQTFRYYFEKYVNYYDKWKEKEKQIMVNQLLIQYFDIKNTLNQTYEELYKTVLNEQQNKIEKYIKIQGCEYKIEKLQKENPEIKNILIKLNEENKTGFEYQGTILEIIGKKAFWDNFVKLLKENDTEKANIIIYDVISNFVVKLKNLIPNRIDLHKYYDEYYDIEYIKQLIDNKAFDYKAMIKLINFSMEELQKLDSAYGCKKIQNWLDDWEIISECYFDIHEVLPYALRDIINKVEQTEYITNIIKNNLKNDNI